MNYDDYLVISSEIQQLESLLSEIPNENAIERMGLESRLESARLLISGVNEYQLVHKAKLTFRGHPVFGSHGIFADFASKAAGAFTDAVTAVAAGLSENLRYMGPIPNKEKNQLLITGTAVGSFGFEFELPKLEDNTLIPESSRAEDALEKVQKLFQLAAQGTDDEVAELVDEIHPRAVKKAADFLDCVAQHGAWCGLEFKNRHFHFYDVKQLLESAKRIREDNIRESDESYSGEIQGVLPSSRTFEFKLSDQQGVLRCKVGTEIEDADVLNRDFLHKPVHITLHIIQVGQGLPRYSLLQLRDISHTENKE
ncbi:MAG: hypothetical protein NTW55_03070 [Planctomycetota bacterium]|nr:hypothetical protein [Planctomycetota bacterium]